MSAVTFDTHEFVKSLQASGMPAAQAEAVVSTVRQAQAGADVATKADLSGQETKTGAAIARLDAKIDKVDAKLDMLKWLLVLLTALTIAPFIKSMF